MDLQSSRNEDCNADYYPAQIFCQKKNHLKTNKNTSLSMHLFRLGEGLWTSAQTRNHLYLLRYECTEILVLLSCPSEMTSDLQKEVDEGKPSKVSRNETSRRKQANKYRESWAELRLTARAGLLSWLSMKEVNSQEIRCSCSQALTLSLGRTLCNRCAEP